METNPEDTFIPGTLRILNEDSEIRNEFLVRLDPENSAIHPNEYIPRDAYDWVSDSIVFLPEDLKLEVPVDEGVLIDSIQALGKEFGVEPEDLPEVRREWTKAQAQKMDRLLLRPQEKGPSGSRF